MKKSWLLVCLVLCLSAGASQTQSTPSLRLYGARIGARPNPKCQDYHGDCLILEGKPVGLDRYTYTTSGGEKPSILVQVDRAKAAELMELSRHNLGKRLAVVVDGAVVDTPRVRAVLGGQGLQLSFCDRRQLDATLGVLHGDPGAKERLQALKPVDCQP